MALVSVTEAARLVRRGRATLYRDIEKGRISKTISPSGETAIDTSELVRAYGQLHLSEVGKGTETSKITDFSERLVSLGQRETISNETNETSGDAVKVQILEEKIRSLERILVLEADLRKVKDQVTDELRARLADKDTVISTLQGQVMLLEYTKPYASQRSGFWSRLMGEKK